VEKFHGLYEKGLYEIAEDLSGSKLNNKDITPIRLIDRNWGIYHYIALWVSIIICVMSYMTTSRMIAQGMSWWQALLTVLLANVIVLIPMVLNSHSGAKYGLSSPVLLRASFGVYGARLPVLIRACVACLWFGIQSWINAYVLYYIIISVIPKLDNSPQIGIIGINYIGLLCYLVVLFLCLIVIKGRIRLLRHILAISAPILILLMVVFLILIHKSAGDWGAIIKKKSTFTNTADFFRVFFPHFFTMIAYWLPLSINISDYTRYAKTQRDHILGQSFGLPITMALFAFSGIAITSSTFAIFSRYVWNPAEIFGGFQNPIIIVLGIIGVLISGVTTNTAVNLVAGGIAFSSLMPKRISFRGGALITAIIGTLILPWRIYAGFTEYVYSWLVAYSAVLTPILGIMLCDYFFIRGSTLNPVDLYDAKGAYRYKNGVNSRAIIALFVGILPSLPEILLKMNFFSGLAIASFLNSFYPYSFFIGFCLSLGVYYFLMLPEKRVETQ